MKMEGEKSKMRNDELMHYGVLGMKWGHRKQNLKRDMRTEHYKNLKDIDKIGFAQRKANKQKESPKIQKSKNRYRQSKREFRRASREVPKQYVKNYFSILRPNGRKRVNAQEAWVNSVREYGLARNQKNIEKYKYRIAKANGNIQVINGRKKWDSDAFKEKRRYHNERDKMKRRR